ncbi:MAG: glycosyltransferase [Rickettsiales bacterium]|nr:glycosyltransferase [Rickettsiales bacterium]
MKHRPVISVILINYNNQDYLADAIESVKNQTFQQWECIVVDDGSTDTSRDIIRNLTDDDLRFNVIFQKNQGGSAARNTGLRAVRGDWIMFLDSDDCYTPIAMEILLKNAKLTNADLAGGRALVTHNDFRPIIKQKKFDAILKNTKPFFMTATDSPAGEYFAMQNNGLPEGFKFIWIWRQLFRRDLLSNIFFPEDLFPGEDILFMLQVMRDVKKIVLVNTLVTYHRLSKTSSVNNDLTESNTTYFAETLKRARAITQDYPPQLQDFIISIFTRTMFVDMVLKTIKFKKFRENAAREIRKTYGTPDFPKHYLSRWQRIMVFLFLKSFPETKE